MNSSAATAQIAVHDHDISYPLWPPLTSGCPTSNTRTHAYPLEIDYDFSQVDSAVMLPANQHGMTNWAQLLPPLDARLVEGVGDTPLIDGSRLLPPGRHDLQLLIKDESRNPTWSHKDRLNVCTVSAALEINAPGIVVASSGNHGASAAAMARRANKPCIVVMSAGGVPHMASFVAAFGAAVLSVPRESRWDVMNDVVSKLGYHPVSNVTSMHTGHPFGPEGYKAIAYEIFRDLDQSAPGAVFVPVGYGELLFGVWKGFEDLRRIGALARVPDIYACEVGGRGVLRRSLEASQPAVDVSATPTDAYSMATTTGGYRGIHVVRNSNGSVIGVSDSEMRDAQEAMLDLGMWQELSGAAGLAGCLKVLDRIPSLTGPIVCIGTSSGMKDKHAHDYDPIECSPDWDSVARALTLNAADVM